MSVTKYSPGDMVYFDHIGVDSGVVRAVNVYAHAPGVAPVAHYSIEGLTLREEDLFDTAHDCALALVQKECDRFKDNVNRLLEHVECPLHVTFSVQPVTFSSTTT